MTKHPIDLEKNATQKGIRNKEKKCDVTKARTHTSRFGLPTPYHCTTHMEEARSYVTLRVR